MLYKYEGIIIAGKGQVEREIIKLLLLIIWHVTSKKESELWNYDKWIKLNDTKEKLDCTPQWVIVKQEKVKGNTDDDGYWWCDGSNYEQEEILKVTLNGGTSKTRKKIVAKTSPTTLDRYK